MSGGRVTFVTFRCTLLAVVLCLSVAVTMAQNKPKGGSRKLESWRAGSTVTATDVQRYGVERCFGHEALSDSVFTLMQGRSFPAGCSVKRSQLRYVRCLHYDAEGNIRIGELVCNQLIADDLVAIFRSLYDHHYPIARMTLIDRYAADDERSMRANNTSCFCYRAVKGSRKLSAHAIGMAVDINPLYNPCVRRLKNGTLRVQPATAASYAERSKTFPYTVSKGDLCYRLFTQHGFRWGGSWNTLKDYQHFEKSTQPSR